jgi:hypothetical protein
LYNLVTSQSEPELSRLYIQGGNVMRISYLFVVASVIALIFGLSFVLLTEQVMSMYGVKTDAGGMLAARLFGTALVGIGVVQWLARNAEESEARRAIVLGLFVLDALGFVVVLLAQFAGTVNGLGWINVVIYLLLTLGYGYFLMPRAAQETASTSAT